MVDSSGGENSVENTVTSGTVPNTAAGSEFFYLNAKFGELNPIFNSGISDSPTIENKTPNGFQQLNKLVNAHMESDILEKSGPYIGIVLRVESNETQPVPTEKNWVERAQAVASAGQSEITPLLTLRVRIPELHAHLPIPKKLPDGGFFSTIIDVIQNTFDPGMSDNRIIKMYPIFSCRDTDVSQFTPQKGSLVWVDFVDRKTQTGGIYLKPIDYTKVKVNSVRAGTGAQAAFVDAGLLQPGVGAPGGNFVPPGGSGADFNYDGPQSLPSGTPPSVAAVRAKIPDFPRAKGTHVNLQKHPERIPVALYLYDRFTLALGWSAAWAAAALVQSAGESGWNPKATENSGNPYPTYGPGFGLFQITNTGGMGGPKSLSYIKAACKQLPSEIKAAIGYQDGDTILPDINENGQIVARDVSYMADLYGGDERMSNANPPPPLRTGKQVKGYYNCHDPRVTVDRWALTVLKFYSDRAYNTNLTAAQCYEKLHWSFLAAGIKSVYVKRANKGNERALEQLTRFSQGHGKRQAAGKKWLGDLWGPLGVYQPDGNGNYPIILEPGQEWNQGSSVYHPKYGQVPVVKKTNNPSLTEQGANFYSSKGGFLTLPRTTIGGITKRIVNIDGNVVDVNSKILNRGIYKVPTDVQLVSNVKIKPDGWNFTDNERKSLRTNRVRPYSYGSLSRNSQNLVNVPTVYSNRVRNQKLHILAAKRLEALNFQWARQISNMSADELDSNNITGIFRIYRGWTRHRFKDDYEYYTEKMEQKYGSLQEGSKYEPFHSAYETGLVFSLGNNGFQATVGENLNQNEENPDFGESYYNDLYSWRWLVDNAHLFGIYPNQFSPWRWEVQVPRANWFSGNEFINPRKAPVINGVKYPYCAYVIEKSIETGSKTSDEEFNQTIFI